MTAYDVIMKNNKEQILKAIDKEKTIAEFAYALAGDKDMDETTSVLGSILFAIINSKKEYGELSELAQVIACEALGEKMIADGTYKPSKNDNSKLDGLTSALGDLLKSALKM